MWPEMQVATRLQRAIRFGRDSGEMRDKSLGPLSRIRYTVGLLPLKLPSGRVSLLGKLGEELEKAVRLAQKHVVSHKRLNRSDRTRLVCRGGSNDRTVR